MVASLPGCWVAQSGHFVKIGDAADAIGRHRDPLSFCGVCPMSKSLIANPRTMFITEWCSAITKGLLVVIGVMAWTWVFLMLFLIWATVFFQARIPERLVFVSTPQGAAILSVLCIGVGLMTHAGVRLSQEWNRRFLLDARRSIAEGEWARRERHGLGWRVRASELEIDERGDALRPEGIGDQ